MTTANGLTVYEAPTAQPVVRNLDDVRDFSTAVARSGFYKDMREAAQAAVKLAISTELGLGVIGMSSVHIVEGKPTLGYQAMLALVKRSGRYNYRFLERTENSVRIAWFENGEQVGETKCDDDDAKRMGVAGKNTWQKFPRQMRTARAVSEGVNTFCPDVIGGAVYTPDELGAAVDVSGEIVVDAAPARPAPRTLTPRPARQESPTPAAAAPADRGEGGAVDADPEAAHSPASPVSSPADHIAACEEWVGALKGQEPALLKSLLIEAGIVAKDEKLTKRQLVSVLVDKFGASADSQEETIGALDKLMPKRETVPVNDELERLQQGPAQGELA